MENYIKILVDRLVQCVKLSVPENKINQIHVLIERHADELYELIKDVKDPNIIRNKFSNFIAKVLSTIEAVNLSETQLKATRKLILSEIHGCLGFILEELNNYGKPDNK